MNGNNDDKANDIILNQHNILSLPMIKSHIALYQGKYVKPKMWVIALLYCADFNRYNIFYH